MRITPNLAGRPFANERPMRRMTAALWVLATLLVLLNVYLFRNYSTTNVEGRDQLSQIRTETDAELRKIEVLRQSLSSFDLREQNEEIRFLNRRIAERAFPWSELFEQLGEVLPRGVMLNSLAPALPEPPKGARSRAVTQENRVTLRINGTAENSEELLTFLDGLFAHPAFEAPLLERERQERGARLVSFDLETFYRPRFDGAENDGAVLASSEATDGPIEADTPGTESTLGAASPETANVAASPRTSAGSPGDDPAQTSETPESASSPAATASGSALPGRGASSPTSPSRRPSPGAATPAAGANPGATPGRGNRPQRTRPQRSRPNASQPPGMSGSGGAR